jgi:RNA polymerase sigma-70 factor (ECF subfamily)
VTRATIAELSDESLLVACGVGDTAALGALFDRHHAAVYRLISRLLRTEPAEIDDLVQQTFLEVWRSANKFGARGAVRSWVFGIAANAVRHHIRGAVRRRAALGEVPPPPASSTPHDAALRAQQVHRLATALEDLPEDLRVVYVMCDLEEVPGVEAARVLGLRSGTLWRRLHEARRALREAIDGGTP